LSIASAKAANEQHATGLRQADGVGAQSAPSAPIPSGVPGGASASTNPVAAAGGAPAGMGRILGQPPMPSASSVAANLPAATGAPHLYHLGRDTFFLDQPSAIGLSREQKIRLTSLKESAAIAYASTQRQIDRNEGDLWVLTSSAAPDLAKIERRVGEIARLSGKQRVDFIRAVGAAVAILSDAQRKAVAAQVRPRPPHTMPPAQARSGMNTGRGSLSSGGAGTGGPGQAPTGMGPGSSMPPQPSEMSGMTDAGSAAGKEKM